ncbi:MAG: hypothetical protein IPM66_18025 [Acidobacteriota bacterium]|nr:MAG: hypothetical protein IPM66_18025 [Acidobacteriota bacterium]
MKSCPMPVTDRDQAIAAKYEIEQSMLEWPDRVLIDEERPAIELDRSAFELSVDWGKLIFAWWDDENSQSWRVLAYGIETGCVNLLTTRGMGIEKRLFRLLSPTLRRNSGPPDDLDRRQTFDGYRRTLIDLILTQLDGVRIERSTTGRALTGDGRTIPGRYARIIARYKNGTALLIGAGEAMSQPDVDNIVAAGLIWLAAYNRKHPRNPAVRLVFCLPRDRSRTALERLALIETDRFGASTECYEVDETSGTITAVRPLARTELLEAHPRELEWPDRDPHDNRWHEMLVSRAPEIIEARFKPFSKRISYSIHGLEFASVGGKNFEECTFGVGGTDLVHRRSLTAGNLRLLDSLIREILRFRSAGSTDRSHPYYRLRTEAWLESKIRSDIRALDARLDDRFVYSQIPAWQGDERSVIDLLAVTCRGRLVVIEIKSSEDMHLPLQGLDYWLRIEQARSRGELARRKLFPGIEIADRSPLLFLVAPNLRFHRSFHLVAGCLAQTVEAWQLGISASWREAVRVRSRTRVNGN